MVSTPQHSMWWHRQRLWCLCSPFATSSSKTIAVVKFRRIDVFMRGHVSEKWDTNGWWPSAAATCCKTARQTTIVMATCPQLMRRAVDSRAIAWRRADTDSSSATSPYIHWTLQGDSEYTAGTLCRLKCKLKYKYQGTLKLNLGLWPNWTRPDPPFPANFLTQPYPTRGSVRGTLPEPQQQSFCRQFTPSRKSALSWQCRFPDRCRQQIM